MSLASGLTALVDLLITVLNARSVPGPSDFQMWKAQDPIPRANATLADYRKAVYGQYMTAAQRLALTGTELWLGREIIETDTGITYKYVSDSVTTKWRPWHWHAIPFATYGTLQNNAVPTNGRVFEASISGGMLTFNVALERSGGMQNNQVYFVLKSGFRPAATLFFTGVTLAATSGITAVVIDVNGNVYVFFSTGASGLDSFAATVTFRPVTP